MQRAIQFIVESIGISKRAFQSFYVYTHMNSVSLLSEEIHFWFFSVSSIRCSHAEGDLVFS